MLCSAVLLLQSAKEASSVVRSPSLSSLDIVYLHQLLLPPYSRRRLIGHTLHARVLTLLHTHALAAATESQTIIRECLFFSIPPVFPLLPHSVSVNVLSSYYPYPSHTRMPKQH